MCVCVLGDSTSKEQNKKKAAEIKESANIEIMAFSPERRWVDDRINQCFRGDFEERKTVVQAEGRCLWDRVFSPGPGHWTRLSQKTVGRRSEEERCSVPWREAWTRWSPCSPRVKDEPCGTPHARLRYAHMKNKRTSWPASNLHHIQKEMQKTKSWSGFALLLLYFDFSGNNMQSLFWSFVSHV